MYALNVYLASRIPKARLATGRASPWLFLEFSLAVGLPVRELDLVAMP